MFDRKYQLTLVFALLAAGCATVEQGDRPERSMRESLTVPGVLIPHIREASQRYGIDPELIAVVAFKESGFDPRAVSPRGAVGLMQLMPRTAAYLGVADSYDPRQNILGGTRYLREMLDEFEGDVELALAAYNAGPTAVKRAGGAIPTTEAVEYVRFIRARYRGNGLA